MVNATTILQVWESLEICAESDIHFEWRGGAYHKVTEKKGDE